MVPINNTEPAACVGHNGAGEPAREVLFLKTMMFQTLNSSISSKMVSFFLVFEYIPESLGVARWAVTDLLLRPHHVGRLYSTIKVSSFLNAAAYANCSSL